jgi:hypothetical protein
MSSAATVSDRLAPLPCGLPSRSDQRRHRISPGLCAASRGVLVTGLVTERPETVDSRVRHHYELRRRAPTAPCTSTVPNQMADRLSSGALTTAVSGGGRFRGADRRRS